MPDGQAELILQFFLGRKNLLAGLGRGNLSQTRMREGVRADLAGQQQESRVADLRGVHEGFRELRLRGCFPIVDTADAIGDQKFNGAESPGARENLQTVTRHVGEAVVKRAKTSALFRIGAGGRTTAPKITRFGIRRERNSRNWRSNRLVATYRRP